jgi:hemoglobin-like flavoprotein
MGDVTAAFYRRMFAVLPEARALFPADLTAQRRHFAAALALLVRNLAVFDALEEPLRELGAAHARLGVAPWHLPVGCDALLEALAGASDGAWDDALAADWKALLLTVTRHMLAGALNAGA